MHLNTQLVKDSGLLDYLNILCGDGTGFLCIATTDQPHLKNLTPRFFAASDASSIATHIQSLTAKKLQVVVGFARLARPPISGRGKAKDISVLSAIGMDIDIADPNKPNKALPRSIDEALEALETLPLPPTLVIKSGSGLHAYWALDSDLHINDEEDRKQARAFISNFYRGVAAQLPQFSFDATHDLARMFRAPDSYNLKDVNNPLLVSVLVNHASARRYTHDDVISVSVESGSHKPLQPLIPESTLSVDIPMDVKLLEDGCNWFREAWKNGESASYSEWFAVASLLSKSPSGRELFHQWSSGHPDYDPSETDAKFDQVDPDKADRTCVGLASIDGGKRCARCPFKGAIKSPIELAIPSKRAVITTGRQLPEKTSALWAGVHVQNNPPRIFSYDNQIARVNESDSSVEILDLVRAKFEFARQVNWLSSVSKGWGTPTNPCPTVIQDALATPFPPLPKLKGVVSIPVMTESGELLMREGYDDASGIFHNVDKNCVPQVNLDATREDARAAVQWIEEEVLADFPFEDKASKAAAISLAILPFIRELIAGQTPLYLIDKPSAGTGATMLTKALLMAFIGKEITTKQWTSTEDERRKQITAHLMSGGGPIFFDNMSDKISSNVLAMALTSETISDRVLQTSKLVTLRNRSIWAATGNNPQFEDQLLRRIVRVRLVPVTADPTARTGFRHPELLKWLHDNRKEFVEKILTIIVAWSNAGRPMFSGKGLASYESYSRVVGGIVEFVGIPGFLTNLEQFKASQDSERVLLEELVKAWWSEHGGQPMKPKQVCAIFKDLEVASLWDAPTERGQVTKTGKWLSLQQDRIVDLGDISVQVMHSGRTFYLKEVPEND